MVDGPKPWPLPFAVGTGDVRLTGLLDALPLGLALIDWTGCLIASNDAFSLSVDHDCPLGAPLPPGLTVPAQRSQLARAIRDALSGSVALPIELRLRLPARPDEPLVMTIAKAPPGVPASLLIAVRDIREQLRLENQVAQVTRMQAIGQLAGGIAHDFNNILTANIGLIEQLLTRHPDGDAEHDDLGQVQLNNERGAALVQQLLAFARQQTLRVQLVEVRGVIERLAELLRRLIGDGIILRLDFAPEDARIRVDPGQLEQVIVNLAVNARDAMPGGGTLDIVTRTIRSDAVARLGHSVMPFADYVEIAVYDSGTGIPRELAARIFEPFFTTKDQGKGTGLGLSTVYGIVKQSGGFVFNAPGPGGGTVFTLYFPLAEIDVDQPAPPEQSVQISASGARILLVEDDRAVRQVLRRALERGGHVVTEAVDALAALPLVEDLDLPIDVLVSDVMMPGMDGAELAARARAVRPVLPIVLMSGYAEPSQRDRVADPSTAFIAKPFTSAVLLASIAATLLYGDAVNGTSAAN